MLCPECNGKGVVKGYFPNSQYLTMVPCRNDSCHGGLIHCCDGERPQKFVTGAADEYCPIAVSEMVSSEGIGKHWKTEKEEEK